MIRFLIIASFILAFSRTDGQSQSFGVSPVSHKLWGETVGMSEFYVEYSFFGIHYFHNRDENLYGLVDSDEVVRKTSSIAFSVVPIDFTYFRSGVIFFDRRFPVTHGSKVQILLEASLPVRRFTLSYRHISNGFGVFNEINPGIDSFSVKYRFE